jgi:hypothetical protein
MIFALVMRLKENFLLREVYQMKLKNVFEEETLVVRTEVMQFFVKLNFSIGNC